MTNRRNILACAAAMLFASTLGASAQDWKAKYPELTFAIAMIALCGKMAKADGVVTPQERARLQHEANRNSREIRRETHDRQHARK